MTTVRDSSICSVRDSYTIGSDKSNRLQIHRIPLLDTKFYALPAAWAYGITVRVYDQTV